MNKIDTLQIHNFKFFQQQEPIKLGGNHMLLYGENGSGKSSIYWSLYTLFEASLKPNDNQIRKYFSKIIFDGEDCLVNINACETYQGSDDYDSFIEVITDDLPQKKFKISANDLSIRTDIVAKEINYASDFINYRLLLLFSSFAHSEPIDLYRVFTGNIFYYVRFQSTEFTKSGNKEFLTSPTEMWNYILDGPDEFDKEYNYSDEEFEEYVNSVAFKEYNISFLRFHILLQLLIDDINRDAPEYLKKLGYSDFKFQLELKRSYYTLTKDPKDYLLSKFSISLIITEYNGMPKAVIKAHSFLNEARFSAMAISIRLAILKRKLSEDCLKFIVLDDLLISLDMRNREKVLDLLLSDEFSSSYQLIILTHDRLFFQLAKSKIKQLGHTNWVNYEMFEDVINGKRIPFIRTEESYIERARNQYYIYKDHESAGNYLRKEAELFCKNFLPNKLHFERKTFAELNLSGKLLACIEFAKENNIDKTLFEKLDNHRKYIFNALSHDSYDVPLFKNELEICFDTFSELNKLLSITAFLPESKLHFEISDGTDTWRYDIELYDEFKLIKEVGKASILSSGMINYFVYKKTETRKKNPEHKRQCIKTMYEYAFSKSDQTKNPDFWEEIIISETNQPLKSIRKF